MSRVLIRLWSIIRHRATSWVIAAIGVVLVVLRYTGTSEVGLGWHDLPIPDSLYHTRSIIVTLALPVCRVIIYIVSRLMKLEKGITELANFSSDATYFGAQMALNTAHILESAFCLRFLQDLVRWSQMQYARNEVRGGSKSGESSGPLYEAFQGIRYNLQNWESRLAGHEDPEKLTEDSIQISVWLRAMRSYFYEESFDIRQRVMVTNGRNFCFMLLATLEAFLEYAAESERNQVVHYQAFTPVHPSEWYNWPHGYGAMKTHCESDFLGVFHRTLAGIVERHNLNPLSARLQHERYIIASKADDPVELPLTHTKQLIRECDNIAILPFAVPCELLHEQRSKQPFKTLYNQEAIKNVCDNQLMRRVKVVVPVVKRDTEFLNNDPDKFFRPVLEKSIAYYKKSVDRLWRKLTSLREDYEGLRSDGQLVEDYRELSRHVKAVLGEEQWQINVFAFVQCIHRCSVRLSQHYVHKDGEYQDKLAAFLRQTLRLRECLKARGERKTHGLWRHLGMHFQGNLHSENDGLHIASLSAETLRALESDPNLTTEFSVFGISSSRDRQPDWQLILATTVQYPFEVGQIRIVGKHDEEWGKFEVIQEEIFQQSSPYKAVRS